MYDLLTDKIGFASAYTSEMSLTEISKKIVIQRSINSLEIFTTKVLWWRCVWILSFGKKARQKRA
ncbi:MAG: hypothetical protein U5K51_14495 [Flavobacteriaceae bacterium]|nr:hypothetical protein [Flavobacteriaceae bacterium]